jgi:hypothetical protein
MESDYRLQVAAIVAGTFKIDPIEVMQADYFDWRLRLVATKVYWEERSKAEKRK